MSTMRKSGISVMLVALWLGASGSLRAQTFTTLYQFGGGSNPGLAQSEALRFASLRGCRPETGFSTLIPLGGGTGPWVEGGMQGRPHQNQCRRRPTTSATPFQVVEYFKQRVGRRARCHRDN